MTRSGRGVTASLVTLSGKQRRHLRALAHPLEPVVRVGHGGLSPALLAEIDRALVTHELIKVKLSSESPVEPSDAAPEIERATRSDVAQIIGRTLVIYRRRAKDPKIRLPRGSLPDRMPAMPANEYPAYVVVAGFDFSAPSARALDEAIRLASEHPTTSLYVLHVASSSGATIKLELEDETRSVAADEAGSILATRVREHVDAHKSTGLPAPKRIETRLSSGSAASQVVAFAAEVDADLIVVGTHGRTGVRRLLLGSVADTIVRAAGCGVLVVRAKDYEEPTE